MDYLLISSLYLLLETYFLVSLRIIGFFITVPIFGGQSVNTYVRISISMITAFIIMTSQLVSPVAPSKNFVDFMAVGFKELAIGLILGFSIYIVLAVFYYIGQLVDFQIGFSMVSVFDPINQIQIPISGNLFYLSICFLLVLTGAHYNFFRALFYSYRALPIGVSIITSDHFFYTIISLFSSYFALGFQTALPIVGTMLVVELALGILNKAAPQMHIFSIGMSIKVLFGLVLLYFILPMFSFIAENIFVKINETLFTIIEGMVPR